MINRIKAFLSSAEVAAPHEHSVEEKHLAAAALLVEAACLDGHFDARERTVIERVLTNRFALAADEVASLMELAQTAQDQANQLLRFTRTAKDSFSAEERVELIEMLWEVVYADGKLDDFEENLLRRVAGLIYVSDLDRGAARKRVLARLGYQERD